MVALLKRKVDYRDYSRRADAYRDGVMVKYTGDPENLVPLIKKMTNRRFGSLDKANMFPEFKIEDKACIIKAKPLIGAYNSRLHSYVISISVETTIKGAGANNVVVYRHSYGGPTADTVFEVIDSIVDDITETAWHAYEDVALHKD